MSQYTPEQVRGVIANMRVDGQATELPLVVAMLRAYAAILRQPAARVDGATQEYMLRAMALNYSEGHSWDRLDTEACSKAADEIASLRAALSAQPAPERQGEVTDSDVDAAVKAYIGDHPYPRNVEVNWNGIRNALESYASAHPAAPVGVPDGMTRIGHLIATQDNRITEQPIFIVQQKRESVGHPDYDNARIAWVSDENSEAGPTESAELESAFADDGIEPKGWRRLAICVHWDFVTACFTEQGCKDYLARNGHNLREPRIYAEGSFRNEEWREVRSFLLSIAAAPSAPQGTQQGEGE